MKRKSNAQLSGSVAVHATRASGPARTAPHAERNRTTTGNQAALRRLRRGIPADASDVVRCGTGRPLDEATRHYFGARFGQAFDDVRVHTGPLAAASANALQANAYTVGNDIVLREAYDPASSAGRRLLAHELTHVVQQRGRSGTAQTADGVSDPADASEREAEAIAERAVAGERVRVNAPPTSVIALDRRAPDVNFNNYQSFMLDRLIPGTGTEVRVQFHQDPSNPAASTMAVWLQETNSLQTVTFNPGGPLQAAVLSEEPGIVTFDLDGDEAPEVVLTVAPNASLGVDLVATFRGTRILTLSALPPAPTVVPGRGRLIGRLPNGHNYYFTGTFDRRGPRYVDDEGMMVDPGREIGNAELLRAAGRTCLISWAVAVTLLFGAVLVGELAGGAAMAGEATGGGGVYAGLTNSEIARQLIGAEQTALLRTFFGTGLRGAAARAAAFELPAGLTRASLLAYAEIARRVIAAGNDTLGVQAARLELIERALRLLP